jgi:hypothetical protein
MKNRVIAIEGGIKLQFDLVVGKECQLQIKSIIDNASHIYHAMQNWDMKPMHHLPTDKLPFRLHYPNQPILTVEEQRKEVIDWMIKKAFEDFLVAITKSLVIACNYLGTLEIIQSAVARAEADVKNHRTAIKPEMVVGQINWNIDKLEKANKRLHVPLLIDKIKSYLGKPLEYEEQILSINRLRNCFVHQNSIADKDLVLKWISKDDYGFYNDAWIELNEYEMREKGMLLGGLNTKFLHKERTIHIGDKVELSLDEFNEIALTIVMFSTGLNNIMPLESITNQSS